MTVSSNDTIDSQHFITLYSELAQAAGLGSGSNGYGSRFVGYENYKDIVVTDSQITNNEWNSLKTQLQSVREFQTSGTIFSNTSINRNDIIYANTNSGDGVTGVNELTQVLAEIKAHFGSSYPGGRSGFFEATSNRSEVRSPRSGIWGKSSNPGVTCTIRVTFNGGYNCTDSNGNSVQASGADHLRHFFNIGCDIRLSAFLSGFRSKDSNWATMLSNAGQLVLTRTNNYQNGGNGGTLYNTNLGAFDLGTNFTLLYEKFGTDEYAENRYRVSARRFGTNNLDFKWEFDDFDLGGFNDPDPKAGAKVDEFVFEAGGSMAAGIDLRYTASASPISVPKPSYTVTTELENT